MATFRHYRRSWALALALIATAGLAIAAKPVAGSRTAGAGPAVPSDSSPPPTPAGAESAIRTAVGAVTVDPIAIAPLAAMPAKVTHLAPAPAVEPEPVTSPLIQRTQTSTGQNSTPTGWGCAAALAYLRANAQPSFELRCPGDAHGNQAMSCNYDLRYCPDSRFISIAVPCPAAYMNEAHNSWVMVGRRAGIDPFGSC